MRLFIAFLCLAACAQPVDPIQPPDLGATGPGVDMAVVDIGVDVGVPPEVGCDACTTFVGAQLFDGQALFEGALVIEGARIIEVVRGEVQVALGAQVDARGKSILPGMFDMHVHTPAASGPYGFRSEQDFFQPHFKAMLRSGVTSYLDLGTSQRVIFEHRARIFEGEQMGPRLFAAGPMLTPTGGHPCTSGGPAGDACIFIDRPEDAQKMEALLLESPNVIKVIIESGVLGRPLPQLNMESLQSIVQRARAAGIVVIAHVSEAEDMRLALDVGIDAFAHMPGEDLIPEALAQRLAQEEATIVSTLAVYENLRALAHGTLPLDDPTLPLDVPEEVLAALTDPAYIQSLQTPSFQSWTDGTLRNVEQNFQACLQAGVRFAAGTDAGNPATFHGLALHRELQKYVELGMSIPAALQTATSNAADLLGEDQLGRLVPGAKADLVLVEGLIGENISNLNNVSAVYRAGVALDRMALALPAQIPLTMEPPDMLGEGEVCLSEGECGAGLFCGWQDVCAAECDSFSLCPTGSACFPQGGNSSAGFCYEGDDCDPIAQDCVNGTACIWLGNSATLCWFAGLATAGQPCDGGSLCQPGHQCDFQTGTCVALCDPGGPDTCAPGTSCVDQSAVAGVPVGECR